MSAPQSPTQDECKETQRQAKKRHTQANVGEKGKSKTALYFMRCHEECKAGEMGTGAVGVCAVRLSCLTSFFRPVILFRVPKYTDEVI